MLSVEELCDMYSLCPSCNLLTAYSRSAIAPITDFVQNLHYGQIIDSMVSVSISSIHCIQHSKLTTMKNLTSACTWKQVWKTFRHQCVCVFCLYQLYFTINHITFIVLHIFVNDNTLSNKSMRKKAYVHCNCITKCSYLFLLYNLSSIHLFKFTLLYMYHTAMLSKGILRKYLSICHGIVAVISC